MDLQLSHSAVPIFAAGFIATAMIFGGLAASGPAIGLTAARIFGEPIVELAASVFAGAVASALIGRRKP